MSTHCVDGKVEGSTYVVVDEGIAAAVSVARIVSVTSSVRDVGDAMTKSRLEMDDPVPVWVKRKVYVPGAILLPVTVEHSMPE